MKKYRRLFDVPFLCVASLTCWAAVAGAAERNPGVPVVIGPPPERKPAFDDKVVPATRNTKPARLSAGLDEVLKLNKAGVEESVVLEYIHTSPIAFYPTADEIVILRERGISGPVLAALLQHGAEVRQRDAAAAAAEAAAADAPEAPTPPAEPSPTKPPPVPEPVRVHSGAPEVYSASSPGEIYSGYPSYSYSFGCGYYPYAGYSGYHGGYYPTFSVGIGFGGYGGYYGHHGGSLSTVHGSVGFHGDGH